MQTQMPSALYVPTPGDGNNTANTVFPTSEDRLPTGAPSAIARNRGPKLARQPLPDGGGDGESEVHTHPNSG